METASFPSKGIVTNNNGPSPILAKLGAFCNGDALFEKHLEFKMEKQHRINIQEKMLDHKIERTKLWIHQ